MYDCDVVIVGAGPAGLAAAARLTGSGQRVALIDAGKPIGERDRNAESEMTRGHGGAGLFSDGKFSFFPSATGLWSLPSTPGLRAAFDWTCSLLNESGLKTPEFPSSLVAAGPTGTGEWALKEYPSDYLPLEARLRLTANLVSTTDARTITETEVTDASYDAATDIFHLGLRDAKKQDTALRCRRLLIATGRFGPLGLRGLTGYRSFRRLEVGFRIEQPAGRAFFREMRQLDPKLWLRDSDGIVEWRTFCACRQGEAVLTETSGLWTVSGRSDCPPTGRSNVGFNTRILDEKVAEVALAPMLAALSEEESFFEMELSALLSGEPGAIRIFDEVYGATLRSFMTRGLRLLSTAFPEVNDPGTRLIGPTLEGVGWYPRVAGGLRLLDSPGWVAGDACGLFRGIVAAMISGHYAASAVLADLSAP